MTPEELEFCPFCGESKEEYYDKSAEYKGLYVFESDVGSGCYVKCLSCGADGPRDISRQLAIKKWNRRAKQLESVRLELPRIIYGLMAEYREHNWGSYEEEPITDNAIKNTVELIRKLKTYPTDIAPDSDGGVDLEFGGLSVCVMGDGYVHYAMLDPRTSGKVHINDNLDGLKSLINPTQTSEER